MTSPISSSDFPPLTRQAVDDCKHSNWFPKFRKVSPKTTIIPLDADFITWLQSDGLRVPKGSDAVSQTSDHSDEEEVSFHELDAVLRTAIEKYDGAVFPKLNWSCPQDASWINAGPPLKCTCPADVYLLLKASDFVSHDLHHAYDECVATTSVEPTFELVVKKWFEMPRSHEFRCFVRNQFLVAICQRDHNYYDFLCAGDVKVQIVSMINTFFANTVKPGFDAESYTFDVYLTRDMSRVFLIDFNPFAQQTDSLLFAWAEILYRCKSNLADWEDDIFRVMRDPMQALQSMPRFSHNRYPKDIVELSHGKDPSELAKAWNDNLAEALAESLQAASMKTI